MSYSESVVTITAKWACTILAGDLMISIYCIPVFEDLSLEQFGSIIINMIDVEKLVQKIGHNSKLCIAQFVKFKS